MSSIHLRKSIRDHRGFLGKSARKQTQSKKGEGIKIIPIVEKTIGKSASESHKLITKGFDIGVIDTLKSFLKFSNLEIADIAGISESKLHRKRKADEALSPAESDRIYRVVSVILQAIHTFDESEAAAVEWVLSPQIGLGGNIPIDLLTSDAGTQDVRNLLGRIKYGVYS